MSVSGLTGALSFHLVPLLLSGLFPTQFQQEGHVQRSLANNFVYPQKEKSVLPLNLQKQAETWEKIRRRVEYLLIKSTYSWRIYTYSSRSSSFLSRVFILLPWNWGPTQRLEEKRKLIRLKQRRWFLTWRWLIPQTFPPSGWVGSSSHWLEWWMPGKERCVTFVNFLKITRGRILTFRANGKQSD